ncbi:MAG: NADH-quinone oxidoreductase subunit G, partial [Brevundimonas sp.]
AILRALSERLGKTLPYDSLEQLRARLMADHPTFGRIDYLRPAKAFKVEALGNMGEPGDTAFRSAVADPYLMNPIQRASATMAELSAQRSRPVLLAAE